MGNCGCNREKMIENVEFINDEIIKVVDKWETALRENPEFRNCKTFMYYGHLIDTFYKRVLKLYIIPESIREEKEKQIYSLEKDLEIITVRLKQGIPDINIPWCVEKYCRRNPDWKNYKLFASQHIEQA